MKSNLFKIVSVVLALAIVVCSFGACNIAIEEEKEPITRTDVQTPSTDVNADNGLNGDLNTTPDNGGGSTGGTIPGEPTGGNSGTGGSTGGSSTGIGGIAGIGNIPQIDWAATWLQFYSNFDTPEERIEILRQFGYEYDADQQIFYTHLNPWQRQMGFTDGYDLAAPLTNMWYLTLKVDFSYGDYDWRLQWWKGQYGVLEGAELGVYTRDAGSNLNFYDCAADENLLRMEMEYYKSAAHYNSGNRLFIRREQEHWWLTGFKFGITEPQTCVVVAKLYARDKDMADKIEVGLQNVTDEKGNWNGFVPYTENTTNKDFYIRNGNVFQVVWRKAGYVNYYYMRDYIEQQQQQNQQQGNGEVTE